ncbi:hypothetical protein C8A05DRAFT_30484 [Staphylotrichum tortipilum]|uniref:Uncharacterized protein n=1 Tax=Staphylotrichum tortipilum TaxID=2831512 RepID=A0AAN6MRB6_9PEZI|nr:hypothetical protein C8A05DRAFT_30484 [Staphylotrichum longicolle]
MATPAGDTCLPGILRLSPATRRRIYWHAGLGPGYMLYGRIASMAQQYKRCLKNGTPPLPPWPLTSPPAPSSWQWSATYARTKRVSKSPVSSSPASAYCRADWPRAEHAAIREWAETVDWMRERLNLPGLTLYLALPTGAGWGHEEEGKDMTQVEGDAVLAGYWRIMEPLTRLGASREDGTGLARFYAELAWPWGWCSWVREKEMNCEVRWDWVASKERQLKEGAERRMMGARYERVCTGPGLPAKSVWPYAYERDC